MLHEHVVAASEAYNTALEAHLHDRLGVRFVDVPRPGGKRPVREVDGVDRALCARWSSRRSDIEDQTEELVAAFTDKHGRQPTAKESTALAQRANLETRERKHEPRSEAEQRATWRAEAAEQLSERGANYVVYRVLHPPDWQQQPRHELTNPWLHDAADRVIAELEAHRATWQSWPMYAEAQRQVRDLDVPPEHVAQVVEHLVDEVTSRLIDLTPDRDPITEPAVLRRSDGVSVYRHTGADHFTSQRMLDAEQRIVDAAGRGALDAGGSAPDPAETAGDALNAGNVTVAKYCRGAPPNGHRAPRLS